MKKRKDIDGCNFKNEQENDGCKYNIIEDLKEITTLKL